MVIVLGAFLVMSRREDSKAIELGALVLDAERAAGVHPQLYADLSVWSIQGPFPVRVGWRGALRTDEQQAELFKQGRDEGGNIVNKAQVVTNAQSARDSAHGRGAALDLIPLAADGSEDSSRYPELASWWRARGYKVGVSNISGGDPRHVEMLNWGLLPFPPNYG